VVTGDNLASLVAWYFWELDGEKCEILVVMGEK
jgi:hypothetical protein